MGVWEGVAVGDGERLGVVEDVTVPAQVGRALAGKRVSGVMPFANATPFRGMFEIKYPNPPRVTLSYEDKNIKKKGVE